MITVELREAEAQCNSCLKCNFKRYPETKIYQVSIGPNTNNLVMQLCEDCVKQFITEAAIALLEKPTIPDIEKCDGCGEIREVQIFAVETNEDVTCNRCGGTFQPYITGGRLNDKRDS